MDEYFLFCGLNFSSCLVHIVYSCLKPYVVYHTLLWHTGLDGYITVLPYEMTLGYGLYYTLHCQVIWLEVLEV